MYFVLYQLLFLYCICILYCNQCRRTATRDQLSLRRPTYLLTYLLRAVSALTLLVGRHEEHPACKKLIGDVLVWLSFYLSGVRCTADCLHVVQLMPPPLCVYPPPFLAIHHCLYPKTHNLLRHWNPDWFYISGTGLPGWPGNEAVKRV